MRFLIRCGLARITLNAQRSERNDYGQASAERCTEPSLRRYLRENGMCPALFQDIRQFKGPQVRPILLGVRTVYTKVIVVDDH